MLKAALQVGLAALLLGSPAWAQEAEDPTVESDAATESDAVTPAIPANAGSGLLQAENVTDEQVEQVAAALLEIEPLLRQATEQLAEAESNEQRQTIASTFEQQATQLVTAAGLTVDEYRQLIELANTNSQVGQRIAAQIDALQDAEASEETDPEETEPASSQE